jgi:ABC-2 type transport system permease protein
MPNSTTSIQYLFPGTLTLMVLFTSIFSTLSMIEDRREGFLQSVMVAPISRGAIVLGKLLGGTAVASIQALLFLFIAPWIGIPLTLTSLLLVMGVVLLMGLSLTGLGFFLAWRSDSVQGFHSMMNLVLIPMWLLSGSFFPVHGAPVWLEWMMKLNPLTYGVAALRRCLYWGNDAATAGLPSLGASIGITLLFGIGFHMISVLSVQKKVVQHG